MTEFPTPLIAGTSPQPQEITSTNGLLWFTESGGAIGVADPSNPVANQPHAHTTIGHTDQQGITVGPDGNLWFTELLTGAIGKISPASPDTATSYTTGLVAGALPTGITVGPDGLGHQVMWFTDPNNNRLGKIDTSGNITELPQVPSTNVGFPTFGSQITAGPDGKLYFTEATLNADSTIKSSAIGIYDPTANSYSEVALAAGQEPFGITVGPDGNIWFGEAQPNPFNPTVGTTFQHPEIGVINLSTNPPARSDFPISTPAGGVTPDPFRITAGPDGNLWFTDTANAAILSISPTSHVISAPIAIPKNNITNSKPTPAGITAGPDGNVWFVDNSGAIGKVTLDTQLVVTTPTPPATVAIGSPFSLGVAVQYTDTHVVKTAFNGTATVALSSNPGGSTLGGTLTTTVSNGVATFSGLTLNKAGNGYKLQVTANGLPPITTNAFNVASPTVTATQLVVTAQPPGTIPAGTSFGLIVKAETASNTVDTTFNGNVTVAMANNPGGATLGGTLTVSAVNGVATFSGLTLSNAGVGYVLKITSNGLSQALTAPITVTSTSPPPPMATQLVVTTQPPGTIPAGTPFTLIVKAETASNTVDTTFNGNVTVAMANNPGGATLGGTLTVTAVNGVATFSGLTLSSAGVGYVLYVTSNGLSPTLTAPITVTSTSPPPVPPPAEITGQSVLFTQKTNKKGKKVGKPVLTGFQINFNTAMNPATTGNQANYSLGTYVQVRKRVGRKTVKVLQLKPIGFSVTYSASNNSVALLFSGKQTFSKGGQITLIATPPGGISSTAGGSLDGNGDGTGGDNAVFNISSNARSISHA